jgi:hypothetical protein
MIPSYAFHDQGDGAALVIPWNAAHDDLGYVPASNCDANHCEMWVREITGEAFAHSGAYNDTLRFSFAVDRESLVERQGGEVLTLGAYVHEPGDDSLVKARGDELRLCVAVAVPFQVPFSEIGEFAFFLDIKRAGGRIDRVWLNNGPCNFVLADLRNHVVTDESRGASSLYHIADASPLFNQKRSCRR